MHHGAARFHWRWVRYCETCFRLYGSEVERDLPSSPFGLRRGEQRLARRRFGEGGRARSEFLCASDGGRRSPSTQCPGNFYRFVIWAALAFVAWSAPAVAANAVLEEAADCTVVWNSQAKRWAMLFTDLRAQPARLALAESADGGATWQRIGPAALDLPPEFRAASAAGPEAIAGADGQHHLFLSLERTGSENAPRKRIIAHLASADLRSWTFVSTLNLAGDQVGAPSVSAMPGGGWRLWYGDEGDGSIRFADSRDLKTWTDRGKVASVAAGRAAPCVFTWRGRHWMIVDGADGPAVYRSLNLDDWSRQPAPLFAESSRAAEARGHQSAVVVSRERAVCFFADTAGLAGSSIHAVELREKDGSLTGDRAAASFSPLDSPDTPRNAAGSRPPAPALTDRDPGEAAMLRAVGSRDIRAHDPSMLVRSGDEYWLFYTGRGLGTWRSKDLRSWTAGAPVFAASPAWVADVVPENRGTNFWAPDIIQVGNRFLLYYSVSTFGKRISAIALATNATLDPDAPGFKWQDEGVVVRSGTADNFNAIDPAVMRDADGKLWLTFGSYWSGIKLLELDPATGKRIAPGAPLHSLAHSRAIEAAYLHRHGSHYYLFVNHGWCCRGVNSTYHIRVGRSEKITGPYLDREGRALLEGGGTVVAESEGPFIGPGHASILTIAGREWFGCHFYDAAQLGRPTYALRPVTWDAAGWPVLGMTK